MNTKQIEALRLALEKVQEFKGRWWKVPPFGNKVNKATREAITNAHSPIFELEHAIREALAEQPAQQEPVAWMWKDGTVTTDPDRADGTWIPLYTSPPASKPWVGLSTDEIYDMYNEPRSDAEMVEFARAIEAKLREKNEHMEKNA